MRVQHTKPTGSGHIAEAIRKLQTEVKSLRASEAPNALTSRTSRGTAIRPFATSSSVVNQHVVARWL